MIVHDTGIKDLLLLEPKVFGDHRGYFLETFRKEWFDELTGGQFTFVQDNESKSGKGVLRGLHFQHPPFAQGKLVRVVRGSVLDVALDIRRSSPTYGKHFAVELSESNKLQLWIPPGFAHGFASLEDDTIFQYKCTNYYSPENEGAILWCDPELNIDWKINAPLVSDKDQKSLPFASLVHHFR